MRNIKTIISKIVIAMLICVVAFNSNILNVRADASVSISVSATQLTVGQGLNVTVSVGGDVSAYTLYVSYDSSVLEFSSGGGAASVNGGGGTIVLSGTQGSTNLSFTAVGNGSSYIGTSGDDATDINGNDVSFSHAGVSVNVGAGATTEKPNNSDDDKKTTEDKKTETTTEDDGKSANCNLSSLQITPGELQPQFSPDITSYYVNVEEDVTSMVVSAVAEDSKATTAVSGAGLIEKGENSVRITVTAENGAVKVYYIRVVAGKELGEASVNVNNAMYRIINDSDKIDIPEGYAEKIEKYKDWDILTLESPNKKIKLVCLVKEEDFDKEDAKYQLYIFDAEKDTFTPYFELSSNLNRYIIIDKADNIAIPNGFTETKVKIGANEFKAYKNTTVNDADIYLVYAMNISGDEGFYVFDASETSFMRYVPIVEKEEVIVKATPQEATVTDVVIPETPDEGFFTKEILLYIIIGLGLLLLLFIYIVIRLKIKNSKIKEELDKADDMVNQLASVNTKVNSQVLDILDDEELNGKNSKKNNNKVEGIEKTDESEMTNDNHENSSKEVDNSLEAEVNSDIDNNVNASQNDEVKAVDIEKLDNIDDTKKASVSSEDMEKTSVNEETKVDEETTVSYGSMIDEDKELKDIVERVISEVKESGIHEDNSVENNAAEVVTNIIDDNYDANKDSAFADIVDLDDNSNK